jgi:hypothetical protein
LQERSKLGQKLCKKSGAVSMLVEYRRFYLPNAFQEFLV